ncbi:MAG: hypothetical protein NTW32_26450 [Chloroflexi bacterium]|nr:hypothetical protein [Chloroflexota bacterium]
MYNTDLVNMIVAIYGAICGTAGFVIALILGVIEFRRNQPQVKLRLDTLQFLDMNPRSRNKAIPKYLAINVSNLGTRPVNITSFSILDKQRHILMIPDLIESPFKLEDGESHDIKIPVEMLSDKKFLQNIWKIRILDGTGKTWETKFGRKHKEWILDVTKNNP